MSDKLRDEKIVDDILSHLDGWRINDHPHETRKIQSFLDPDEAQYDNLVRKEVSTREVLRAYDMAKVHALNYIRRKEFPNSPAIYQAICYWAAGLLSEKAHFKDEKIQESTLLIEEARQLLSPHVKKSQDFFLVSGDEFFWEEYMRSERHPHPRRDRIPDDWDGDEEKERLTHGLFHEHYHYKPPHKPRNPCFKPHHKPSRHDVPEWIRNRKHKDCRIITEPIVSDDGETAMIRSRVVRGGEPVMGGKLMFYVYVDE